METCLIDLRTMEEWRRLRVVIRLPRGRIFKNMRTGNWYFRWSAENKPPYYLCWAAPSFEAAVKCARATMKQLRATYSAYDVRFVESEKR